MASPPSWPSGGLGEASQTPGQQQLVLACSKDPEATAIGQHRPRAGRWAGRSDSGCCDLDRNSSVTEVELGTMAVELERKWFDKVTKMGGQYYQVYHRGVTGHNLQLQLLVLCKSKGCMAILMALESTPTATRTCEKGAMLGNGKHSDLDLWVAFCYHLDQLEC